MQADNQSFSDLLEQLRRTQHISKTDLAKLAHLTPGYISHLTQGKRTTPSEEVVRALANALGLEHEARNQFFLSAGYGSEHVFPPLDVAPVFSRLSEARERYEHWGDAPDTEHFYGREMALATIEQWVVGERCRLVAVLGLGGVGKTTLAAKLVRQCKEQFDYIFWRSLHNAPPPTTILKECIQFLSNPELLDVPENEDAQIELLGTYFQKYRCLVVLDNLEAVLQSGEHAGEYSAGRKGYGRLVEFLGNKPHQSCLLVTSREKPREIAYLEGIGVRSLVVAGIGRAEGQAILQDKGLFGDDERWTALVQLYAGNPLALKLVSAPIREVFGGDIAAFLRYGDTVIGNVYGLLDQQFQRLSPQERSILYWLAVEREALTFNELREDFVPPISRQTLVEVLESLRRRSFIESSNAAHFSLQPVIMEYVTSELSERIFQEIASSTLQLLGSQALIKAQARDYIRESQVHLILKPLAERLSATFGKDASEHRLKQILALLHTSFAQMPASSYAAGNLINLLLQLGCSLRGYDFSNLRVWQAYLRGVALPEVNFSHADLAQSIFMDTFGGVLATVLSPDGTLLAAGTTNSEIRIWRAADGMPLLTCEGHADWVRSVAFSPDARFLASGGDDQTVRLWDSTTGQCLVVLEGHSGRVYSVAFSPDGRMLASGSEDQTVRLWNIAEEGHVEALDVFHEHTSRVRSVAFSPDGRMLASGSEDQTVRLWQPGRQEGAQFLPLLLQHQGAVWSVAFSPDGRMLASGCRDQTVRLWEVRSGQCLRLLEGHARSVWSVAFNADGNILASGSQDQTVRLWEVSSGQCLKTLRGHANLVMSVAFSADGSILASGSEDQTMRLWETDSGQCLKLLQGHSNLRYAVTFSPDGQLLANGNEDQTVCVWDWHSGQALRMLPGHVNRVRAVTFSPDGQLLASGSDDHTVRLWEVGTGQSLKILHGHRSWVKAVAFSPGGQLLASGSDDRTIRLWNFRTGQCFLTLHGHRDWIWSIAFSPDGSLLASSSEDRTVRLWEVKTGRLLRTLEGHTGAIWSVAFNPAGDLLASGSHDQSVRLWEVSSGNCLNVLSGHMGIVEAVVFSPTEDLLVSGSHDQTLRIWEVSSGHCLRTLAGHTSWIYSVGFHPQGETLASSSGDGTIKLWNVSTGHCIQTLRGDRPYERMNIKDVRGLTANQQAILKELGAIYL